MTLPVYRPWGKLPWIMARMPNLGWSLLGCVGTERRSLAAWEALSVSNLLSQVRFILVHDPVSTRFFQTAESRLEERKKTLGEGGITISNEDTLDLLCRSSEIVDCANRFVQSATGNLIIDLSSFPKRFFFPILKIIMRSADAHNLIVTYTLPEGYGSELASNPMDWAPLPLFREHYDEAAPEMTPSRRTLIIGIGFEPLGLPNILKASYQDIPVKMLFPFPPGPPYYGRAWELVRQLEVNLQAKNPELIRIDPWNVSSIFDRICAISDHGQRLVTFAPFGPKTVSLAMCLYAISAERTAAAYYTQPREYNPDYTTGVATKDTVAQIYAYLVRIDGRNLYSL